MSSQSRSHPPPPPRGLPPELPPGVSRHFDSNGVPYYCDANTGKTSWAMPIQTLPPPHMSAPSVHLPYPPNVSSQYISPPLQAPSLPPSIVPPHDNTYSPSQPPPPPHLSSSSVSSSQLPQHAQSPLPTYSSPVYNNHSAPSLAPASHAHAMPSDKHGMSQPGLEMPNHLQNIPSIPPTPGMYPLYNHGISSHLHDPQFPPPENAFLPRPQGNSHHVLDIHLPSQELNPPPQGMDPLSFGGPSSSIRPSPQQHYPYPSSVPIPPPDPSNPSQVPLSFPPFIPPKDAPLGYPLQSNAPVPLNPVPPFHSSHQSSHHQLLHQSVHPPHEQMHDPSQPSPFPPYMSQNPSSSFPSSNLTSNFSNLSCTNGKGVAQISLEMSAVGLKKCDLVTQSDPICNVYIPTCPTLGGARNCKWKKIGSTEVLWNTKTPSWTQRVRVSYNFAKHQLLRFSLVDVDNKKTKAGDDLGCCDVSLASIVRNGTTKQLLTNQKGKGGFGTLTIHAHDENAEGRVRVTLMLRGSHLDKKDLNGSSDPYYKLCSVIDGFGFTSTLYTSPTIPKTLNPAWQSHTFYVPTQGMPLDRVHLSCTVHDENKLKADKVIGEAWFTLKDLERLPTLPLIKQTKAGMRFKKSKNKNSGELIVQLGKVQKMPSFISFLHGGLRLNLIVAVDFTASNKSINDPLSLHNMSNPNRPSPYYQALHGIGSVLSAYVSDDSITGLGFGASLPGHGGETSFDFSLDGSHDGKVKGVQGLLQAYKTALRYVTFSGPTNFTTLIQNAMKVSMAMPVTQNNMHFSILLILTDGIITDMSSTVNAIIEASHIAPLEILIVGIGDANFEEMRRLDGDTEKLRNDSKTRQAKHDIVHFVKYDPKLPIEELASEVLKEIPQRVVEFMVDSDIQPIELSR